MRKAPKLSKTFCLCSKSGWSKLLLLHFGRACEQFVKPFAGACELLFKFLFNYVFLIDWLAVSYVADDSNKQTALNDR